MSPTIGEIVAVASLLLNIVLAIVGLTWGLAKVRDAIKREIADEFKQVWKKITEMELWNRDNFARRDSVHTLGGRLEQQIVNSEERVIEQVNKLEAKVDKIIEREK